MSTEPADTPRLRASDSEREEYATIVREAVGEGRLDIAEGDTRLAAIYAAKYQDELAPLVTDLPAGQAKTRARRGERGGRVEPGAGPWGPVPWDHSWGRPPSRRARPAGGVVAHTGFVVLVAAGLTLLWVISGAHFFWPAIPLFFLVVGLGRHWRWATWRRSWQRDRG